MNAPSVLKHFYGLLQYTKTSRWEKCISDLYPKESLSYNILTNGGMVVDPGLGGLGAVLYI